MRFIGILDDSPLLQDRSFMRRALGGSDVCLELHRVRTRIGYCINESVGEAQAAVVRLRHLADNEAAASSIAATQSLEAVSEAFL